MNTPRETIYAALFALVADAGPFATTSRRFRLITEMQPGQMPALFMSQAGETLARERMTPPRYTLRVDLAIYAQNPDANQSAAPQLNALLDAVEAALAPPAPALDQTLGGLVSHCYLRGEIELFEGSLGNRAGAVIPIEIVTT